MNDVHYSSKNHAWETPQALFDALNEEFGFTLDAAASPSNAKCPSFYTDDDDALTQPWRGVVFCNPPYGRGIGSWVKKGFEEAVEGARVVMLIPARTDTSWWHRYVMKADEVRLIHGRLYFKEDGVIARVNAPFPSCVVVFGNGSRVPRFSTMARVLDPGTIHSHNR